MTPQEKREAYLDKLERESESDSQIATRFKTTLHPNDVRKLMKWGRVVVKQ